MKASVRQLVRSRAGQRCEYCRLHEDDLPLWPFHVEHIRPTKHGGTDDPRTLAWSCHYCNLSKSSNLSGIDNVTGRIAVLFNPRRQRWNRHFRWNGAASRWFDTVWARDNSRLEYQQEASRRPPPTPDLCRPIPTRLNQLIPSRTRARPKTPSAGCRRSRWISSAFCLRAAWPRACACG